MFAPNVSAQFDFNPGAIVLGKAIAERNMAKGERAGETRLERLVTRNSYSCRFLTMWTIIRGDELASRHRRAQAAKMLAG